MADKFVWGQSKPNDKKIIAPLFPTPVVVINIGRDFTEDELQSCTTDILMKKTKNMLNHRSEDLYLFDNYTKELQDIKNFCESWVRDYMEEIEGADTELVSLRITQSWLNKNKPQEYHHMHNHPNSYISGVLYIKCLPNDGINFEKQSYRNSIEFPVKETTVWNASGFRQPVTKGDLILFPSWILHSVDLNETEDVDRLSLAFNTFPEGELGEYNEVSQLFL